MTSSKPLDRECPKWRTGATIKLQFRANFAGRYIEMRMCRVHLTMWGYNSVFKQIRRCSVDGPKRYENDKCGRKSFWKRSKTAPFSFENGLVWTGPMRCNDIYDRHDTSATPCTCSEAKNKLAVTRSKNIGKETSLYKSEGNFSHIRKLLMTCVTLAL